MKSDLIFLVFVDNCLLFCCSATLLTVLILAFQVDFVLTDEGDISYFLGIQVTKHKNCSIELTQPTLIWQVVELLGICHKSKIHKTPVVQQGLLHSDFEGPGCKQHWHYHSAIVMLNYLAMSTCLDIAFATHQCACFCTDPKLSHEQAVKCIC